MTCKDAIERLVEYLDGELTASTLAAFEAHLGRCAGCRAYLATYRRTNELVAKAHQVAVPERLRAKLRDLLEIRRGRRRVSPES
jgi:anti-sigma factor (TIGR02949 family)